MSLARSSRCLLVLAFGLVGACVEAPSLTTSSGLPAPDGGAIPPEADAMVFVPEVTVDVSAATPVGVLPTAKGEGQNDDKGKGKDKDKDKDGGADAGQPGDGDAGTVSPQTPAPLVVPAFWIDATETSVASYRLCVSSGACDLPAVAPGCTLSEGLETNPVTCVTIDQARVFCTWIHKRLATGDELSAAAGGAARRAYPWGDEPPAADRLNACGSECAAAGLYAESDGFPRSAPTASFLNGRTPEGAYDLAGNVAEWVDGAGAPVTRGGSYEDVVASTVSSTGSRVGGVAGPSVGFRCAADAGSR